MNPANTDTGFNISKTYLADDLYLDDRFSKIRTMP